MAEINIKDLNELAKNNPIKMIADSERAYHDRVREIAKRVVENDNIRLILLAGPSGSGKTTTANLVADAIRSMDEEALVISLDNFYRDLDDPKYPKLENGERDSECPESLDIAKVHRVLDDILEKRAFGIPKFDFKIGRCAGITEHARMERGCVIIEGLHALNPLITDSLPSDNVLKMFISVSTNINSNGERILSGRKIRFVRRLVRDAIYRGASVEKTLSMWRGVLAAEDVYLYPYRSSADISFDTFHDFELCVMKNYVDKLITEELSEKDDYVKTVRDAMSFVFEIDEKLIPENSLIKEFIVGGVYESLY